MSQSAPASSGYRLEASRGLRELWWLGGRMAVKALGEDSGGRLAQIEVSDPRGTAPPRHIHHREDETLLVVEGEVLVYVADDVMLCRAGDFAFMPRGVEHTYLVRSDRARRLITFAPGGFERFFAELGVPAVPGEAEPPPVVPDPETMARRLAPYGVEIVGPPPSLG
jgi:quercetin dioxygenase-like cupin family protein